MPTPLSCYLNISSPVWRPLMWDQVVSYCIQCNRYISACSRPWTFVWTSPARYEGPWCGIRSYLTVYRVTIIFQHAHALELLSEHLQPGMKALDVGSGSGYLTACMAILVSIAFFYTHNHYDTCFSCKLGDNTFVIECFAGINCIILRSQI